MNEPEICISPRFTRSKLSTGDIEDKIDVFEDQMQGWIFDHADTLAKDESPRSQHAGFAILMLVTAYFEQLEALSTGVPSNGKSQEFFKGGFRKVFHPIRTDPTSYVPAEPVVNEWLKDLYLELRNGLYHELAARSRIFLTENGVPIEVYVRSSVVYGIDATAFSRAVHEHFVATVARLRNRDERDLRENFEAFFSNRSPEIEMTPFPPSARSNF